MLYPTYSTYGEGCSSWYFPCFVEFTVVSGYLFKLILEQGTGFVDLLLKLHRISSRFHSRKTNTANFKLLLMSFGKLRSLFQCWLSSSNIWTIGAQKTRYLKKVIIFNNDYYPSTLRTRVGYNLIFY